MVVADGRRIAEACTNPLRSELLRLCDETEILTNQLSDLIAKGQVSLNDQSNIIRYYQQEKTRLQGF